MAGEVCQSGSSMNTFIPSKEDVHTAYHHNQNIFEEKGDNTDNYTGTRGVDGDCPRQIGMCGDCPYKGYQVLRVVVRPIAWGLAKAQ